MHEDTLYVCVREGERVPVVYHLTFPFNFLLGRRENDNQCQRLHL